MPIGQISFMRMDGPVESPYGSDSTGSKYQGQAEPTPSRFYLNFGSDGERELNTGQVGVGHADAPSRPAAPLLCPATPNPAR